MIRKLYSIFLLILITAICVLNFYAYRFHWYWEFWWFDIVMHTLGGMWVASAALWLRYFRNKDREQAVLRKKFVLFFSVFSVYVIGIGWELFEFSLDRFITFKIHDAANTASDLFFDGVGGLFAVFLFFAVYNKYMKMEN
ncbi:MAG: hypothetical protein WCT49_01025 [Candidatus Paceibacterota bacterium]|nr:hypothetical protein [Candidatus Paceibacterota bacterium]